MADVDLERLTHEASRGDPEAYARLAVLAAAGIQMAPSWDTALDWLQRAAELGSAGAQDDLRFLARAEGDDFAALRAGVDLAAWLRPCRTELVRESPRILICRAFMSPPECARVIARTQARMTPADVYDPTTGVPVRDAARTNSNAEISLADIDLHHLTLHARISATIGLPSVNFEPTNILRYRPGEQFSQHYDFLDPRNEAYAADLGARGQRIVTFLVYLNDDYDGGDTSFPRLGWSFKGRTGDALMFGNVSADGTPDLNSLHAGRPPTRGDKWLLSQWVRNRRAQVQGG